MRYTAYVITLTLLLSSAGAQSGSSNANSSDKPQNQLKAQKVWDEDSIQELQGGINEVGPGDSKPANNPKQPQMPAYSGIVYKAITIDGTRVTSDMLVGRVVLVQSWVTWCPHCQADQAAVDRVAQALGSKGLVVLAVNDGEPADTVKEYLQSRPRGVPVILSQDTNIDKFIDLGRYPGYTVIDGRGRISGKRTGEIGDQGMRDLIAKAGLR